MNKKTKKITVLVFMILALFVNFVAFVLISRGQSGSYYHDLTLDSINSSVLVVNSSIQQMLNNAAPTPTNIVSLDSMSSNFLNQWNSNTWQTGLNAETNMLSATNDVSMHRLTNGVTDAISSSYSNAVAFVGAAPAYWASGAMFGQEGVEQEPRNISIPSVGVGGYLGGRPNNLKLSMTFLETFTPVNTIAIYVRSFILAIWCFVLSLYAVEDIKKWISDSMNQPQLHGSGQAILGTNASLAVGGVYIVALVILIAGACSVAFGLGLMALFQNIGAIGNVTGYFQAIFYQNAAWGVITSFVPITGIFYYWLSYQAFSKVYGYGLFIAVRGVKMSLLG